MTRIKKYFGQFKMTWPRVLIFAVITAVATAALNEIPFIHDTSFSDIAVTYECWILFALFIIVNCRTCLDAALKCFVFFLVSQPLIYLCEVPFETIGWEIFGYYKFWFILTVFTLPGAAIAFFIKKKNWLSFIILSVATVYFGISSAFYFRVAFGNFPRHLLSTFFCLALSVFLVWVLLDKKSMKIASLGVLAVSLILGFILSAPRFISTTQFLDLGEGEWTCETDGNSVFSVEMMDGDTAIIRAKKKGSAELVFENEDGAKQIYRIEAESSALQIEPIE